MSICSSEGKQTQEEAFGQSFAA